MEEIIVEMSQENDAETKTQDVKEQFLYEVLDGVGEVLGEEDVKRVQNALWRIMHKYEITLKKYELVQYEESEDVRAFNMFFAVKKVEGCSPKTLRVYRYSVTRFMKIVNKPLKDITTNDIRYYLVVLMQNEHLSPKTLNSERRNVSSFFAFLTAEEFIPKNPMLKIKKIKEEQKVRHGLSADEVELLRDNCEDIREEALFEFLYSTGCRISEVSNTNIENINFDRGEVKVLGKGNKERVVYLSSKAKLKLKQYIGNRTSGPLFVSKCTYKKLEIDGVPQPRRLEISGLGAMIRFLGRRAGVENVHPHKIRRTTATKALQSGMSIDEVQKILGHESIETTTIYAKTNLENVKRKHEQIF